MNNNNKEWITEIKFLNNDKVVKITDKKFIENIKEIAKNWADYYKDLYHFPNTEFKGRYDYFYKDIYSDRLIIIEPDNYDIRVKILKETVKKLNLKESLFIGFYVPFYE